MFINEETYIVLNKIKTIDQRLNILAKEFGKLNTNNIFVQPILRAYMEDIQQDIF